MYVAFIAGTLGQGGAEQQLFYMLKALKPSGHEIRLLHLTQNEHWEPHIKALGVRTTYVGHSNSRLRRLHVIASELRREPCDIVQSAHFYTNLYAVGAARLLGLRDIGAVRNDVTSELAGHARVLGSLSLHMPRLLAVNSTKGIENALAVGRSRDKIFYLPNVVDTDRFLPGGEQARDVRLLLVGRLVKAKRAELFLKVLASVRSAEGPSVTGIIVGDGPERTFLESEAAKMGLDSGGVRFVGRVDDTAPFYRDADILMLTSRHEGTPNVVLEAMASGLPVIATAAGDVPNMIRSDETGIVVGLDDFDQLCRATLDLVRNRRLQQIMGRRARDWVVKNHSEECLLKHLNLLYAQKRQRRLNAG